MMDVEARLANESACEFSSLRTCAILKIWNLQLSLLTFCTYNFIIFFIASNSPFICQMTIMSLGKILFSYPQAQCYSQPVDECLILCFIIQRLEPQFYCLLKKIFLWADDHNPNSRSSVVGGSINIHCSLFSSLLFCHFSHFGITIILGQLCNEIR